MGLRAGHPAALQRRFRSVSGIRFRNAAGAEVQAAPEGLPVHQSAGNPVLATVTRTGLEDEFLAALLLAEIRNPSACRCLQQWASSFYGYAEGCGPDVGFPTAQPPLPPPFRDKTLLAAGVAAVFLGLRLKASTLPTFFTDRSAASGDQQQEDRLQSRPRPGGNILGLIAIGDASIPAAAATAACAK